MGRRGRVPAPTPDRFFAHYRVDTYSGSAYYGFAAYLDARGLTPTLLQVQGTTDAAGTRAALLAAIPAMADGGGGWHGRGGRGGLMIIETFDIDKDGKVTSTQWDSPAFNAGIVSGSKVLAVNGNTYDGDGIKDAVTAAKSGAPVQLVVQRGNRVETVSIAYKDGLRYPWLERATPGKAPTGLSCRRT